MFKHELYKTSWDDVIYIKNPNNASNYFLHKSIVLYQKYFPKQNIRINKKGLQSPWIARGTKKSSKRKQKLYVKFLKNKNSKNEIEYGNYKKLFESIKKCAKKNYFLSLVLKHKNNIKEPGMLLKKQQGKRDIITKKFIQKKSYQVKKLN